jgi:hypothetical protein
MYLSKLRHHRLAGLITLPSYSTVTDFARFRG